MCIERLFVFFFFQAEDGIRDDLVTGVQTCALPISRERFGGGADSQLAPVAHRFFAIFGQPEESHPAIALVDDSLDEADLLHADGHLRDGAHRAPGLLAESGHRARAVSKYRAEAQLR